MIDNMMATTKEYGDWRKEKFEEIIVNKLRSALLRLTFDYQIGEEIRKYYNEMNRHVVVAVSNLESEILYLNRRIGLLEMELQTGGGKSYYADMIQELKDELTRKQAEQVDLQNHIMKWNCRIHFYKQ